MTETVLIQNATNVYPHSLSINRPIKKDDLLGSGADGNIDGYHVTE